MLEAQRVMAGSQCDVARSFSSLFGCFGAFGVEPRRVGGPTRHGALPMRRGVLFLPSFWGFWTLGTRATSCWRPNATWRTPQYDVASSFSSLLGCSGAFGVEPRRVGSPTRHGGDPIRRGTLFLPSFWGIWTLWARATSCWRSNATWWGPNAAWQGAIQCDAPLSGHFNTKSHPRTKSEVADLFLIIWFLVCLTCQLGH